MTYFACMIGKEKTLYEDCEGHFLTDPGSVQLYLTDIVEFFKDCLPLKAMLFPDNSGISSDDKISQLASEVITLKHIEVESSIIATTCWNESDSIESEHLVPISIPVELQITVAVLGDKSEDETLYQNTRYLFDNFDPSEVQAMSSSDSSSIYISLKQPVRTGYEYQGLEILRPSKVYSEGCGFRSNSINHAEEHQNMVNTLKNAVSLSCMHGFHLKLCLHAHGNLT